MSDAPADRAAAVNPEARLRATVLAFPGQRFAVVDGGHFEDVTVLFRRARLFARSLFLDHADVEVEKAGPWLVSLDQSPEALDLVFGIVGQEPAAVYWCCDGGEAVLYRHLRGLNMARIPAWAADGGSSPPVDGSGQQSRTVMFRHWDPRVLTLLLPVMSESQFRRITGPAEELAFLVSPAHKMRRILTDDSWPIAPPGLLSLDSSQASALAERQAVESEKRTLAYIETVIPGYIAKNGYDEVIEQIRYSNSVGRDLGVVTERGLMQWTFLMIVSKGRVANEKTVLKFVSRSEASPDQQVDMAFREAVEAARVRDGAV